MFPSRSHSAQKGFLIPLAAFLLVAIAILALTISRLTAQSSTSTIIEGVSLQAFYAAESGAYFGLSNVIYNVPDRATADSNCAALVSNTINFTANGLQACSTTVSCSQQTVPGNPTSYYTIRSEAECGSGTLFSERIIEVSAFY